MNSKLIILASVASLAAASDMSLVVPSGWTGGSNVTVSWSTGADASFYSGNTVDLVLYGPVASGQDTTTMTPLATLASGVDIVASSSASVTVPSSLTTGNYFVCGVVSGSGNMRCTPQFAISGVTAPVNTTSGTGSSGSGSTGSTGSTGTTATTKSSTTPTPIDLSKNGATSTSFVGGIVGAILAAAGYFVL